MACENKNLIPDFVAEDHFYCGSRRNMIKNRSVQRYTGSVVWSDALLVPIKKKALYHIEDMVFRKEQECGKVSLQEYIRSLLRRFIYYHTIDIILHDKIYALVKRYGRIDISNGMSPFRLEIISKGRHFKFWCDMDTLSKIQMNFGVVASENVKTGNFEVRLNDNIFKAQLGVYFQKIKHPNIDYNILDFRECFYTVHSDYSNVCDFCDNDYAELYVITFNNELYCCYCCDFCSLQADCFEVKKAFVAQMFNPLKAISSLGRNIDNAAISVTLAANTINAEAVGITDALNSVQQTSELIGDTAVRAKNSLSNIEKVISQMEKALSGLVKYAKDSVSLFNFINFIKDLLLLGGQIALIGFQNSWPFMVSFCSNYLPLCASVFHLIYKSFAAFFLGEAQSVASPVALVALACSIGGFLMLGKEITAEALQWSINSTIKTARVVFKETKVVHEAMCECIEDSVDFFAEMLGYKPLTGQGKLKSRFTVWTAKVAELAGDADYFNDIGVKPGKVKFIHELYHEGLELSKIAATLKKQHLQATMTAHMQMVKTSYDKYASSISPIKSRQKPVVILLQGPAGNGKTLYSKDLARALINKIWSIIYDKDSESQYIYTFNGQIVDKDQYMTGLCNQLVMIWSDFDQKKDCMSQPSSDLAMFLHAADSSGYKTLQAFDNKGKSPFEIPIIICTTNTRGQIVVIHDNFDTDAINRRVDFFVSVSVKKGFESEENIGQIDAKKYFARRDDSQNPDLGVVLKLAKWECASHRLSTRREITSCELVKLVIERYNYYKDLDNLSANTVISPAIAQAGEDESPTPIYVDAPSPLDNLFADLQDGLSHGVFLLAKTELMDKFPNGKTCNLSGKRLLSIFNDLKARYNCDASVALAAMIFTFELESYLGFSYVDGGVEISGVRYTELELLDALKNQSLLPYHAEAVAKEIFFTQCTVKPQPKPLWERVIDCAFDTVTQHPYAAVITTVLSVVGLGFIVYGFSKCVVPKVVEHNIVTGLSPQSEPTEDKPILAAKQLVTSLKPQSEPVEDKPGFGTKSVVTSLKPQSGLDIVRLDPCFKEFGLELQPDPDSDSLRAKLWHNNVVIYSDTMQRICNGLIVQGGVLLCPDHCWRGACNFNTIKVYSIGTATIVEVKPTDCEVVSAKRDLKLDSDLCVVNLTNKINRPTILKHIATDEDLGKFSRVNVILTTTSHKYVNRENQTVTFAAKEIGVLVANAKEINYMFNSELFTCRTGYSYDYPTEAGDCGAVGVAVDRFLPRKILFMHVAGNGYVGMGCTLSATIVNRLLGDLKLKLQDKIASGECGVVDDKVYDLPFIANPYAGQLGLITKSEEITVIDVVNNFLEGGQWQVLGRSAVTWHHDKKNTIQSSPFNDVGAFVPKKFPVNVTVTKLEDPLILATSKFKGEASYLNEDLFDECVEDALQYANECPLENRRVLTNEEAVFGCGTLGVKSINLNAGPGYLYRTKNESGLKGKNCWFNLDRRFIRADMKKACEDRWQELANYELTDNFYTGELKVELRPANKAPRWYNGCEIRDLIAQKRLFGAFEGYSSSHWLYSGQTIGLDVHTQFGLLFSHLRTFGNNWFDGDFTSYDGTLQASMIMGVLRAIIRWYNKSGNVDIDDVKRRYTMSVSIAFAKIWVRNMVISQEKGNPSGNYLTGRINSLLFQAGIRYIFRLLMIRLRVPAQLSLVTSVNQRVILDNIALLVGDISLTGLKLDFDEFNKNVGSYANGDDNVGNISDVYFPFFNMQVLAEGFKLFNMIYTDPLKGNDIPKRKEWHQVVYLKRVFVEDKKFGALDIDTIYQMLMWFKRGPTSQRAQVEILQGALWEAYYHGKEVYDKFIRDILFVSKLRNLRIPNLPSFAQQNLKFLMSPEENVALIFLRKEAECDLIC